MIKRIKTNRRKGFTLIELIVVMAVLAILVLLAAPKFLGHTKEATFTKHINNAKVLEDASERYYIDHGKWPRGLDEDVYTPEEVASYAERIYDITGEELALEEGNYWDIDYDALDAYAKLPDENERANYVLRNPVGKVYYLEGLNKAGETRVGHVSKPEKEPEKEVEKIPDNPDVKIGKGEVVSVMEYGNEPVSFSGLSAAAYDGDEGTYHTGGGNVTWNGDLAHREIEIIGTGNGTSYPMNMTFLDKNNKEVKPGNSNSIETFISNSSETTIKRVKVVVPENATKMKFYGTDVGRIYEIRVPERKQRPEGVQLSSLSTTSGIELNWRGAGRAIIWKDGLMLADVTGQTYKDTPLYAGSTHVYDVTVIDEYGNGQAYTYEASTSRHIVAFRGLNPSAFDGNSNTYHTGSGIVTWKGDLSNREIEIVGTANGNSYPMYMKFLDEKNQTVNAVNSASSETLISNDSTSIVKKVKVVVPEKAVKMQFYGTDVGRIYDINLPETEVRPDSSEVSSVSTPSAITMSWNKVNRAIIYKNGKLLADVNGKSYTDKPLYPESAHTYEVILMDAYGNGHKASHDENTTKHVVVFRGLKPEAFDADSTTYHTGAGIASWIGNLENKTIEISGTGNGTSYPMKMKFLDVNNKVMSPANSSATETLISNANQTTIKKVRIIVPKGAVKMEFYGTGEGRIYDIVVID